MLRSVVIAVAITVLSGCAAVFPEVSTRFDKAPETGALDPPPPGDRHFVRVIKGRVPARTRDGRTWDQAFGSLPDPYVKVLVNGKQILKTSTASDTLEPDWSSSPGGNFVLSPGDKVEVQIWDSNPLNDGIIGKKDLRLEREMFGGETDLELSGECGITIEIQPAKAIWGAGFWYELRRGGARITRMLDESPATRAGLQKGDEIIELGGKPIEALSTDEVRSVLGAIPTEGVPMSVKHKDGSTLKLTVKEGPIYPLFSKGSELPVSPD